MNKKLFSWKALAGLALLVAMGLTSCKQGTEVDPNDPYATKTPTKPGTSTKDGDLTFTVTKSSDLVDLWNAYDATKKAELMKKTTLNIVVNSAGYKLDGGVITLPKFFNTTANSVLNLTFKGNFQDADKQAFKLDASTNLSGALVNVTLPAQTFNMDLNASSVKATLASDGANIGVFNSNVNTGNNALVLKSGVTVKGITLPTIGDIVKDGGELEAAIVSTDPTVVNEKGVAVGSKIHVKSLIIDGDVKLTGANDKTVFNTVTINKGKTLTIGTAKSYITSIVGLGDMTKAAEQCKLVLTGDNDDLANIGSIKGVYVDNGTARVNYAKNTLENVEFKNDVKLTTTSISNVKFDGDVDTYVATDNTTIAFSACNFVGRAWLTGAQTVEIGTTKTQYQWDIDKKVWVLVTAAAPLTAANAADGGIEVSSNDVAMKAVTGGFDFDKGADKVGAHTQFTIVKKEEVALFPKNVIVTLDDKCKKNGTDISGTNINNVFYAVGTANPDWYTVQQGGKTYKWTYTTSGWFLLAQ